MKSYNLSIEFTVSPKLPQPPRQCMLCFSLPDEVNEAEVYALFQEELLSVIMYAQGSKVPMPASIAVCKAAKAVKGHFGGESFMLEASASMVIELC